MNRLWLSVCVRTVGPSGLMMFNRITSQPDGLGYGNGWPFGPEEIASASASAVAVGF